MNKVIITFQNNTWKVKRKFDKVFKNKNDLFEFLYTWAFDYNPKNPNRYDVDLNYRLTVIVSVIFEDGKMPFSSGIDKVLFPKLKILQVQ